MPSPIGHALAGVTVALISRRFAPFPGSRFGVPGSGFWFVAVCAIAAALADVDFLLPLRHRGPSHSVGAAVLVGAVAVLIARIGSRFQVPGSRFSVLDSGFGGMGFGVVVAVAYATHVLCDWLGADSSAPRGLMALWPFSNEHFISDWNVFNSVERRYWLEGFWRRAAISLAREIAILLPLVAASFWFAKRRTRR